MKDFASDRCWTEEYAEFSDGCLYLTLEVCGLDLGFSVIRKNGFDGFYRGIPLRIFIHSITYRILRKGYHRIKQHIRKRRGGRAYGNRYRTRF